MRAATKDEIISYIKMIDTFMTEQHIDYEHFQEVKRKLKVILAKMDNEVADDSNRET